MFTASVVVPVLAAVSGSSHSGCTERVGARVLSCRVSTRPRGSLTVQLTAIDEPRVTLPGAGWVVSVTTGASPRSRPREPRRRLRNARSLSAPSPVGPEQQVVVGNQRTAASASTVARREAPRKATTFPSARSLAASPSSSAVAATCSSTREPPGAEASTIRRCDEIGKLPSALPSVFASTSRSPTTSPRTRGTSSTTTPVAASIVHTAPSPSAGSGVSAARAGSIGLASSSRPGAAGWLSASTTSR